MPQNPGALKRQKELARLEWQKDKAEKKKQRKLEKQQEDKGQPDQENQPVVPGPLPQV
jgi:hypothetical protein